VIFLICVSKGNLDKKMRSLIQLYKINDFLQKVFILGKYSVLPIK